MIRRPVRAARALPVLAVALAALLCAPSAGLARSAPALDKPVVLVTGPDYVRGQDTCALFKPLVTALAAYHPTVNGQRISFTGGVHYVAVNTRAGGSCLAGDTTEVAEPDFAQDALDLAKVLERVGNGGAVDVVTVGSAGIMLRYALTMSARHRAGDAAAAAFPATLDVEDAIAIASPNGGTLTYTENCGDSSVCRQLDKTENAAFFATLSGAAGGGRNPQGVRGTDWSLIHVAGDRFVKESSAMDMDAAHKTVYTEDVKPVKMTLLQALKDVAPERDSYLKFSHGGKEFALTTKGAHVVPRIVDDLLFGTESAEGGSGPAYAKGCVGFNEATGGETIVTEPQMAAWTGSKQAVRVLKVGNLDAVADCFKLKEPGSKTYVVEGPATVRVNGVDYTATRSGTRILIDRATRELSSEGGDVEVSLPVGEHSLLPLWTFGKDDLLKLRMRYPSAATGGPVVASDDGTRFGKEMKGKLYGAEVKGTVTMTVGKGSTSLNLAIVLPGLFGTAGSTADKPQCDNLLDDDKDGKSDLADPDCNKQKSGEFEDRSQQVGAGATISTNNRDGLVLEKANGKVAGGVRLGPFRSSGSVAVEWSKYDAEWKVTLEAQIPALNDVGVKLKVGFRDGALTNVSGEATNLGVPIGQTGFFFQRFALGLSGLEQGKQLEILIGTAVSFLRRIAGKYPAYFSGDLTVGYGAPWKFKLEGSAQLLDKTLGTGSVEYTQGVGGTVKIGLGRTLLYNEDKFEVKPTGRVVGSVSTTGDLDLGASIGVCVKGEAFGNKFPEDHCFGKADMRVTKYAGQPLTQAVCVYSSEPWLDHFRLGFVATLDTSGETWVPTFKWIAGTCDVSAWGNRGLRAADGGGPPGFAVPAGQDVQVVGVQGADGQAPQVTLVGPRGERVATPTRSMVQETADHVVLTGGGDRTVFFLRAPSPGRWTVEPAPGSRVVAVQTAEVLDAPVVSASVRRARHGGFVLTHRVGAAPGQEVRFVERTGSVLHEIARVRGGTGGTRRVRFRPAFGPGGTRQVEATVFQDGSPRSSSVVARFRAQPAPRPGRVRGLRVQRRGRDVVVTWRAAGRAGGGYAVVAQRPDGITDSRIARARRVVLRDVLVRGTTSVTVTALRAQDEKPGPVSRARGGALRARR